MKITDSIKPGDKFYYPSVKGMALLCEVLDKSEKDILVDIEGRNFYLPNKEVNSHGIIIDEAKARAYVSQRIEDPANKIVYLRYHWNDTFVDRAYNDYCKLMGRIEEPIIIDPAPSPVMPDIRSMDPMADY